MPLQALLHSSSPSHLLKHQILRNESPTGSRVWNDVARRLGSTVVYWGGDSQRRQGGCYRRKGVCRKRISCLPPCVWSKLAGLTHLSSTDKPSALGREDGGLATCFPGDRATVMLIELGHWRTRTSIWRSRTQRPQPRGLLPGSPQPMPHDINCYWKKSLSTKGTPTFVAQGWGLLPFCHWSGKQGVPNDGL